MKQYFFCVVECGTRLLSRRVPCPLPKVALQNKIWHQKSMSLMNIVGSIFWILFYVTILNLTNMFLLWLSRCFFVAELLLTCAKLKSIPLKRARGPLNDHCRSYGQQKGSKVCSLILKLLILKQHPSQFSQILQNIALEETGSHSLEMAKIFILSLFCRFLLSLFLSFQFWSVILFVIFLSFFLSFEFWSVMFASFFVIWVLVCHFFFLSFCNFLSFFCHLFVIFLSFCNFLSFFLFCHFLEIFMSFCHFLSCFRHFLSFFVMFSPFFVMFL